MSDVAGDRPVVDGSAADGPVAPGSPGAGPAAANDAPVAGAADPDATHAVADAARMAGEDAPKAPNQEKTEPLPPSGSGAVPDAAPGDRPGPVGGRADEDAGNATGPGPREGWASAPPSSEPSGDVHGVPVPSSVPAEGTSERVAPVDGVTFPAVAPEGLADGETDVAMPSTTHF